MNQQIFITAPIFQKSKWTWIHKNLWWRLNQKYRREQALTVSVGISTCGLLCVNETWTFFWKFTIRVRGKLTQEALFFFHSNNM